MADWTPPQITITEESDIQGKKHYKGICYDNNAVASIMIDNKQVYTNSHYQQPNPVPITLELADVQTVNITAYDMVGNTLSLQLNTPDQRHAYMYHHTIHLASSDTSNTILPSQNTDTLPPALTLTETKERVTVLEHLFYLDGEAMDQGGHFQYYH